MNQNAAPSHDPNGTLSYEQAGVNYDLIDPLNGCADLDAGVLRACPGAFADDPLRMLRGFRFQATLGFSFDEATKAEIGREKADLDAWLASDAAYTAEAKDALKEKIARQGELAWQLARLESEWLDNAEALEKIAAQIAGSP